MFKHKDLNMRSIMSNFQPLEVATHNFKRVISDLSDLSDLSEIT